MQKELERRALIKDMIFSRSVRSFEDTEGDDVFFALIHRVILSPSSFLRRVILAGLVCTREFCNLHIMKVSLPHLDSMLFKHESRYDSLVGDTPRGIFHQVFFDPGIVFSSYVDCMSSVG